MAQTVQDAERCAAKAAAAGRIGMVGHLLRYHPAVVRLIELTRERRFGPLRRFGAARLSSASDRASSILWSLGPHDLSILHALDPSPVASIDAEWRDDGDRVTLELTLESGVEARIELARSNPTKERRLSAFGALMSARFDDVRAPDRIALEPNEANAAASEIQVAWSEPLSLEIDHFLSCVERRATPLTSFEEGASIVRVLARVESAAPRRAQPPGIEIAPGESRSLPDLGG
jgi:predicted dehydrogenase